MICQRVEADDRGMKNTARTAKPEPPTRRYFIKVVHPTLGSDVVMVQTVEDDWKATTRALLLTALRFAGEEPTFYEILPGGDERLMCQADSPGARHYPGDGWGTR